MAEILKLENVSVRYGGIEALKGISLSVEEGSIVSLIGANGSGKTTLLKAIAGLEPVFGGTVTFRNEITARGKDSGKVFQTGADKMTAKKIGLVPEGRGVFAEMTVLENLEMGAFLVRDKKQITEKLSEMFSLFPILKDRKKQKAGSLSGGEQQMLSISRALMNSPELLLLDEPGLGLAPLVIRDIFRTIERLNREDKVTVFLVEQNARMALQISREGYVMETGKIVLSGKSSELLENPGVKAAYLGE